MSSTTYSEADKIITVYTKEFGKIALLARGIKKLKSRKRGALQVFSIIKFTAYRGNGMPVVVEAEVIDSLVEIRNDLKKIAIAFFYVEAISRTTREDEGNSEIYSLLVGYLTKLKENEKYGLYRKQFVIKLVEILGFIPKNKFVADPDGLLEAVTERKLSSVRVGKRILT